MEVVCLARISRRKWRFCCIHKRWERDLPCR
nr:MAG TPA: hypothetical protein [Caudoviricetes sp.]